MQLVTRHMTQANEEVVIVLEQLNACPINCGYLVTQPLVFCEVLCLVYVFFKFSSLFMLLSNNNGVGLFLADLTRANLRS